MNSTADAQPLVTDGGLETDLIYHHGFDLPEFAAITLLRRPEGRDALVRYYERYIAIAREGGYGFVLGSFVGVMLLGLVQTYIIFDGTLSSWWTKIVIGVLLFLFIVLQRIIFAASAPGEESPEKV